MVNQRPNPTSKRPFWSLPGGWSAAAAGLALLLAASGCVAGQPLMVGGPSQPGAAPTAVGMANPASVYCIEQGGAVEIRTAADGSQAGFCLFPDGSECDEWAYFRGECAPGGQVAPTPAPEMANPASAYCIEQGGAVEIRTAVDGSQAGFCLFPDGSECDEWAYFRGECRPNGGATPTPTLSGALAPDAAVEEILATIQLPADAYSGDLVLLPLTAPVDGPPLWALYSTGMRNYDLDPVPAHFLAIFTRDDAGWRELTRIDLSAPTDDTSQMQPAPDYVDPSGVKQVAMEPDRIWLTVDGGVGAHSGVFQLLSFDGETLALELAGLAASPGAGYVADVNGDGQNEAVLNATEPYIFCYACGVRYPAFAVHTWLGDALVPVELSALMMGQRGTPVDELNSQAIALAQAGLWADALAKIDEAVALAGDDDPPTPAGSLRWNQALIRLNHDAQQAAARESAYPLLSQVFYGDYAAAVDLMRPYSATQIFSPDTPLVADTVAQDWQPELSGYLLSSAEAALAVQPELAPAYFVRAWARFLTDPASPEIAADVAKAAELAPDDALYSAAASLLGG